MMTIDIVIIFYIYLNNKGITMHFRVRGNNVQIIKTVTNELTGKAKSVPIGSANLITGKITPKASQNLSQQEQEEAMLWVKKRMSLLKKELEVNLALLPDVLENYTIAIRQGKVTLSAEELTRLEKAARIFRRTVADQ